MAFLAVARSSPSALRRTPWLAGALGLVGSLLVGLAGVPQGSIWRSPLQAGAAALIGVRPGGSHASSAYLLTTFTLVGTATLAGAWLLLLREAARGRAAVWQVAVIAALWSAPLLLLGPVISSDSMAYAAQGALARRGEDVYRTPVTALAWGTPAQWPLLLNTDPLWRQTRVPYGPLAIWLFDGLDRLAAGSGHYTPGWVYATYRALAALSVGTTGWVLVRLAPLHWRPTALALLAASPIAVIGLVGSGHVDAVMVALLALAMLAWCDDRILVAFVLAAAATAVKATAGLVLITMLVALVVRRRESGSLRRAATGSAAAIGCYLVIAAPFGDPVQLLGALRTPLLISTPFAPTTLTLWGFRHAATALGMGVSYGTYRLMQASSTGAGLLVAVWLVWRRRNDPWKAAGQGLLAVVLLSPVIWAWYLAWPMVLLAVRPLTARLRAVLVGLAAGVAVANGYSLDLWRPVEACAGIGALVALTAGVAAWRWLPGPAEPYPAEPALASQPAASA